MPRRFFKGEANLTNVKTQMEPAWRNVTAQGSWDDDERGEKTSLVILTAAPRLCQPGAAGRAQEREIRWPDTWGSTVMREFGATRLETILVFTLLFKVQECC